jgi:hypothetical protein
MWIVPFALTLRASAQDPKPSEGSKASSQETVVRRFVKAFFSEDEKTLLSLATGRAAQDLKAYFWIRRKIHGEGERELPKREPKIEILERSRQRLLSTDAELTESETDVFRVNVDGNLFEVGLDEKNAVILFKEPAK